VTKHENALLSWYTLKEDKNESTTTDQASTWRLISDKERQIKCKNPTIEQLDMLACDHKSCQSEAFRGQRFGI
jgi:hypothetical protein